MDRWTRPRNPMGSEEPRRCRPTAERDRIRHAILTEGWNDDVGAFTQVFGGEALDASALMVPIVGFLPGDDERVRRTIDAIRDQLTSDQGLMYRYRGQDGVPGGRRRSDLQLLARQRRRPAVREIDGETGALLGNFPQAFTHIGLVNAAYAISEAERQK